jgi:hypothetical protein
METAYPSDSFQEDCRIAIVGGSAFTVRILAPKKIASVERYLARITQAIDQPSFLASLIDNIRIADFVAAIADAFLQGWAFSSRKEGEILLVGVDPPRRTPS